MSKWKNNAIDLYRTMTFPLRDLSARSMKRRGQLPVFALFYHRVANDHLNDWTMTTKKFQQQMEWLQANFDIVDLAECQRRISSGSNRRPTIAITFDDGYAENGEFAIPYLVENKIPATYFVTTHHTVNQQPFSHDVDLGQPLATDSVDTLRSYAAAGIEIGAHTRTHPNLGAVLEPKEIVDEVLTATREMELLIGRRIRYFAFPYGQHPNLNRAAFHLLRENGIEGICSAYSGWNEIGGDAFHLQRVHGDPSFARLKNALTFDPRLSQIERYDYAIDPSDTETIARLDACLEIASGLDQANSKLQPTTCTATDAPATPSLNSDAVGSPIIPSAPSEPSC